MSCRKKGSEFVDVAEFEKVKRSSIMKTVTFLDSISWRISSSEWTKIRSKPCSTPRGLSGGSKLWGSSKRTPKSRFMSCFASLQCERHFNKSEVNIGYM